VIIPLAQDAIGSRVVIDVAAPASGIETIAPKSTGMNLQTSVGQKTLLTTIPATVSCLPTPLTRDAYIKSAPKFVA